jgi:hypothetical protein
MSSHDHVCGIAVGEIAVQHQQWQARNFASNAIGGLASARRYLVAPVFR